MPDPRSYTQTDVALANRNKGMPLDALRYDITPVGLHYLLTHFDIPHLDEGDYRLRLDGLVGRPLELSLDELQGGDAATLAVTLECAGNGRASLDPRPVNMPWGVEAVGTAEWTGVRLRDVLDRAGVRDPAVELVFSAPDEGTQGGVRHVYQRSLTLEQARRPEVLLAWAMNGRPLEPQHGAPLRLLVPGWYGMASVKWLTRIEAVAEPFEGPQQGGAYTIHHGPDDPGTPVERMRVRALMTPPGRPDFPSLERTVDAGRVRLSGRAWSGESPIVRVEVGVDGEWRDATLGLPVGAFAWTSWAFEWEAQPGQRVLACRATDAGGRTQPLEQDWNEGGYCNNMVQTIRVLVE
jgi:DMSO/TMAO reductase YedYZ molybdopterin-dependent catalytic subunit